MVCSKDLSVWNVTVGDSTSAATTVCVDGVAIVDKFHSDTQLVDDSKDPDGYSDKNPGDPVIKVIISFF